MLDGGLSAGGPRDGDNVEAGDFFPLGSCDVVMLAESRHVYRVLAR